MQKTCTLVKIKIAGLDNTARQRSTLLKRERTGACEEELVDRLGFFGGSFRQVIGFCFRLKLTTALHNHID